MSTSAEPIEATCTQLNESAPYLFLTSTQALLCSSFIHHHRSRVVSADLPANPSPQEEKKNSSSSSSENHELIPTGLASDSDKTPFISPTPPLCSSSQLVTRRNPDHDEEVYSLLVLAL
jgi:hypothetical protein